MADSYRSQTCSTCGADVLLLALEDGSRIAVNPGAERGQWDRHLDPERDPATIEANDLGETLGDLRPWLYTLPTGAEWRDGGGRHAKRFDNPPASVWGYREHALDCALLAEIRQGDPAHQTQA